MPFCTKCGAKVDGRFCTKCGNPVSVANPEIKSEAKPPIPQNPPPANNFFNKKGDLSQQNFELQKRVADLQEILQSLGGGDYERAQQVKRNLNSEIVVKNSEISELNRIINNLSEEEKALSEKIVKTQSSQKSAEKKLQSARELYNSMTHCVDEFFNADIPYSYFKIPQQKYFEAEELKPSVFLKLHYMDIKDLRTAYRDNDKQIESLFAAYQSRYTTKANQCIYQLMIIALRSELQNILYDLKYEKLEAAIEKVKSITRKYLAIVSDGNQSIIGTLTKFIGELEYLFINAVKIEYNYYVKKEQARQEQIAIREQIKQEAAERKALEDEKKKIAFEESKFQSEIEKVNSLVAAGGSESEIAALKKRLLDLQSKLADVVLKKDEIAKLQNGKAGNIYIISNLGSFGENVFKIGMTRRLDPQERIDELGDASVPFRFDVHSFIFSEDAVSLEFKLHEIFNNKRVNKVNLRKEFFNVSIDELEKVVFELEPTAEFNRTMAAEEYWQSLSSDGNYISLGSESLDDEEELESVFEKTASAN